jgi:hypothetical protein
MQGLKQKELEGNSKRNEKHVGVASPTGLAILVRTERLAIDNEVHGSGPGSALLLSEKSSAAKIVVANTHLVGDPSKADNQLSQAA